MSSPTPAPSCSSTGLGKTFGNEFLHTIHNTALLVCRMRHGAYSLNIVAFSRCIIDTAFDTLIFIDTLDSVEVHVDLPTCGVTQVVQSALRSADVLHA